MKTIKIFAIAAAVIAVLAGCSKGMETVSSEESITFEKGQTVTLNVIAGATETRVSSQLDSASGNVNFRWQAGDTIRVTVNGESEPFFFNESTGTNSATFTGSMPSGGDIFSVQYPYTEPDLTSQTYSSTEPIPHDMMKFAADSCSIASPSFTLEPKFAALRLNFYGTNQNVSKINLLVADAFSDDMYNYTLNISGGVTLSTDSSNPTPFFFVIPAGDVYFQAEVTSTETGSGSSLATPPSNAVQKGVFTVDGPTFTTSSAKTFTAGEILNMDAKQVYFTKVYFSKANLYYDGSTSTWGFEANQYDYRTYAGANSCIGGTVSTTGTPAGDWGLFGWVGASSTVLTGNLTKYGMSTSTTKSDYGTSTTDTLKADWADISTLPQIYGRKWKTLTGGLTGEWYYLLNSRTVTVNSESKESYGEGSVNGVNGLIILPDDWDGSVCSGFTYGESDWSNVFTESTWSDMENAGCVFLPAAGYRYESSLYNVGSSGSYWSSSPDSSNSYTVYLLDFTGGSVASMGYFSRFFGQSVRLVSVAQ